MIAKLGVAASDSNRVAPAIVRFRLGAIFETKLIVSEIITCISMARYRDTDRPGETDWRQRPIAAGRDRRRVLVTTA
jgi:hypothetical protein